jgi:prepilin peptidase CpaA
MPALIVLLLLLIVAAWTDFKNQKIHNWNTYPGILIGFILNMSGVGITPSGWDGLQSSVMGFLGCGGIMLFSFVLFSVGGGDVKLLAMAGAFLGLEQGVMALLWTFSVAFVFALAVIIWQIGFFHMLSKTFSHVWLMIKSKGWVPLSTSEREPLKAGLFLAPSALVAVIIVEYPYFEVYIRNASALNN